MENKQVKVISNIDATIGINDQEMRVSRTWEKRGAVRVMDLDTLRELCYNPGTYNLFAKGILYIEDMDIKKELGFEPEEAEAPVNVIVLSEQQKQRFLKFAPLQDLKGICAQLTETEVNNLVDYAIQHEIIDYEKCQFLKEVTGRDIIKSIELNKLDNNG